MMRKLITGISFAAVATLALATQSMAQEPQYTTGWVAPVAGAAVGTAVGVGLYNGWYGSTAAITTGTATTTAGAIAFGGIAGVGTVALVDGVLQPCRGFQALFGANRGACANGEYVGYSTPARRIR